jgi:hypothetical protein
MGGGPQHEIDQRRGSGLMPQSWAQGMGSLGGSAAATCVATSQANIGWDYERHDWVQGAPAMEELPPPQLPQQPEEPPEVEQLAGVDEYQPLRLETHESFSAKLRKRS